MAILQRQFEAMTDGQQLYAIVKKLNPLFAMDQRQFESMTRGQQLFQVYSEAGTGGGGGGDVTGTNYRIIAGVLQEKNASTGLWQTVVPTGAVNAETIEFGAQGA